MFTRPDDLTDDEVVDALADGWWLRADAIQHVPVGFGSHHWRVVADGVRWFVNVDDLTARRRRMDEPAGAPLIRLRSALDAACLLVEHGLDFVVGPERTTAGEVVREVGTRYAMSLVPHVDGEAHEWGSYPTHDARLAIVDVLVQLHRATDVARRVARVDDMTTAARDQLEVALDDLTSAWDGGPYGEPARELLGEHRGDVVRLAETFDALAAKVRTRPERMVITHGEPHRGNTIDTVDGVRLIDWDTTLIAPPERDLWSLAQEDPEVLDVWSSRSGTAVDPDALALYRLSWDLTEIGLYVAEFRGPHADTEDTRTAWHGLSTTIDPARWVVP